jgi:hypothetical protein
MVAQAFLGLNRLPQPIRLYLPIYYYDYYDSIGVKDESSISSNSLLRRSY